MSKCLHCGIEPIAKWGMCSGCAFWQSQLDADKKRPNDFAIINGTHYRIGDENERYDRGFGGQKFTIKFNDGRVVVTTNLWHQGPIPESWRNLMPDNATSPNFVRK